MTITEAEVKLICCLDALPSAVASTNFTAFNTLVCELADDKADQLVIAREIVMQVKEGVALSKVIEGLGGESTGVFMVRGEGL